MDTRDGDPERTAKLALWDRFCAEHRVAERGVPLFAAAPDGSISVLPYGRDGRPVLRRSAAMEGMVVDAADAVLAAERPGAEVLFCTMRRLGKYKRVVPPCTLVHPKKARGGENVGPLTQQ